MCSFVKAMLVWCVIGGSVSGFVSSANAEERLLVVNFSRAVLSFYADDTLLAEFPAVVPLRDEEPAKLPVRGVIKKVEKNPHWFPTKRTQDIYFEKRKIVLPKVVRADDPRNALGAIRVTIEWLDPVKPTARIHGTNEPAILALPPEKRHRSGGCIRLLNEDAEKLAALIQSGSDTVNVRYIR